MRLIHLIATVAVYCCVGVFFSPAHAQEPVARVSQPATPTPPDTTPSSEPPRLFAPAVVWKRSPEALDFAAEYPEKARRKNKSGVSSVECRVDDLGRLAQCRVVSESPRGCGFGDAQIRVMQRLEVEPLTKDGQPVAGGRLLLSLKWQGAKDQGRP